MSYRLRAAWFAWLSVLSFPLCAVAGEPSDSVAPPPAIGLKEITVDALRSRRPVRMSDDGTVTLDAVTAGERMRVFGEADALQQLSTLPGVASGSDYASGLSIAGDEYSHTFYGISGAPVFFPYHFGGIFSVFNSDHFPIVKMEKTIHSPDMPGRLGGRVDMAQRRSLVSRPGGSVNLGMLAAGISVAAPAGESSDVTASARISFLNLLYGKLLRDNTTELGYGFKDFNLTWRHDASVNDRLTANLFCNFDFLSTDDRRYDLFTRFRWHNLLAAGECNHRKGPFEWDQTIYCSSFRSSFDMAMTTIEADVTSSITQGGTRGHGSLTINQSAGMRFLFGGEASVTSVLPQQVEVTGYGTGTDGSLHHDVTSDAALFAALEAYPATNLRLTAGLRFSAHIAKSSFKTYTDPSLTLSHKSSAGRFTLHAARYTQTLHQVGFSDIGLASNFWLSAGPSLPAQRSTTLAAAWTRTADNSDFEFSADIYYKWLDGASEYDGTVISMLNADYKAVEHILTGKGRNYGAGAMVSRVYRRLTGSAAVAWGRAQRRFPALGPHWLTASVEQRFSTTVRLHYDLNREIGLDGTWTFATGRPITPVKALYLIAENVITVYGERNSRNLPAYHRLDLSASWRFHLRAWPKAENILILSIINAYGHKNMAMMTFGYNAEANTFARHDVASLYKFLPSLAYVIRF